MGNSSNHRHHSKSEDLPNPYVPSTSSPPPSYANPNNRKWSNFLPILVVLVVIGEIAFLSGLDMAKNAEIVNSWTESFRRFTQFNTPPYFGTENIGTGHGRGSETQGSCQSWLEKEDSVPYSRDFKREPIFVIGRNEEWKNCPVGCKFGLETGNRDPDAAFGIGIPRKEGVKAVLRSMESSAYYAVNDLATAKRKGFNVVMTTSLSSDVPVGYFSWAEYDIMAPVQPKTEQAWAAAFISNCGAKNFRLEALVGLENAKVKIDSYGECHRNHDGNVDKVQTLKHYKFSLSFENSNEEDYVTEKFFQSLVAGSVPVVIGAPNIQDFAPSPNSFLHIKEVRDVDSVAKRMKYLAENPSAYNESLRWKFEGPSDSFKALLDMSAVHSSCRLCIHLATGVQDAEEKTPEFQKRPCKCTRRSNTLYHIFVRERGRFGLESIFLRSDNLTLDALSSAVLSKFKSLKHVPIWEHERPKSLRGGDELRVYKIYPVGMTQRQALYTFRFRGDSDFRNHIASHPCAKFEVVFV